MTGEAVEVDQSKFGNHANSIATKYSERDPLIDLGIKKSRFNNYLFHNGRLRRWAAGGATAAITGTVTNDTESDIVAGGSTIIITLTGDTWIAAGALSFDLIRQDIINGLTSAQSELLGWNNVVKALQGTAGVVRTSDTVVTITLDAQITYSITANETITVTVPDSAVSGSSAIVASPTFTVSNEGSFIPYPRPRGARAGMSVLVGGMH